MPKFPFRRSPGDDLRDLFQAYRLEAPSLQLGHSSLDPGKGELEVRDDAGDAVTTIGEGTIGVHAPSGVTVTESGTIKAGAASVDGRDGGKIGSGGTWLRADGKIAADGGKVGIDAELEASGTIDAKNGVRIPYKSGTSSVATVLDEIDVKAGNAATAATGAKDRADDAYELADSKLGLPTYTAMKDIINDLSNRLGDLDGGTKWGLPQNPVG